MNKIILSTAYFAPVQYYSKFSGSTRVTIEQFEHFQKQTYRNRCVVLGGNGPIPLIVPVIKGRGPKILIRDMKIAYDMDWQRNHWRTLFSAYNASPYFEYYEDELRPLFSNKPRFLLDHNLKINEIICGLIDITPHISLSNDFEPHPEGVRDLRSSISPKVPYTSDPHFQPTEYTQVFSDRFPFVPNLSILDLLFNEGPNSLALLGESEQSERSGDPRRIK